MRCGGVYITSHFKTFQSGEQREQTSELASYLVDKVHRVLRWQSADAACVLIRDPDVVCWEQRRSACAHSLRKLPLSAVNLSFLSVRNTRLMLMRSAVGFCLNTSVQPLIAASHTLRPIKPRSATAFGILMFHTKM